MLVVVVEEGAEGAAATEGMECGGGSRESARWNEGEAGV